MAPQLLDHSEESAVEFVCAGSQSLQFAVMAINALNVNMTGIESAEDMRESCSCGPFTTWTTVCCMLCGSNSPCNPLAGCCHVGACCGHYTCWTGVHPMRVGAVALSACCGKFPCAAGSCFCMHGGFGICPAPVPVCLTAQSYTGLHKMLEFEVCCFELKCHKEGKDVGCVPEAPKVTGLLLAANRCRWSEGELQYGSPRLWM